MDICVVHLSWSGAGADALERFITSYAAHDAGVPHRLVVAWKGHRDADWLRAAERILAGVEHDELTVGTEGLDLASYREVAEQLSCSVVCFLNSGSVILAEGWLGLLTTNLSSAACGLVGATGSYESPLSGARLPLRLLRLGRYPPFPNPHVRTNAFMLDRRLMSELWWPAVTSKGAAYELESGNRSITRQIEARGLQALVVGRDGVGYAREQWQASATFRSGDQANLLVADNRTRQYAGADYRLRRRLARLAWGEATGG